MKIIETLHWILDKEPGRLKKEEEYLLNIEFVHSLGLQCDSVGWSTLDLQSPRADEILSAVDSFCKSNGWMARGVYTRKYTDYTSDWYELVPTALKDNALCDSDECESERGETVKIYNLRAYHELRPSPKLWGDFVLVPERFRDACLRHGITDVDFCWARDTGKYEAEQYFHLYGNHQIPHVAVCRKFNVQDGKRIDALGGYLPKIAKIFYDINPIIQKCFLESELSDCRVTHAFAVEYSQISYNNVVKTVPHCYQNSFLIHKDLAEILLREKALTADALRPVLTVTEPPAGYTLDKTEVMDRPTSSCIIQSIAEYEKLKNKKRPVRTVSEKDALKLLRTAKKERKEDFKKALSKAKSDDIAKTNYAPILPYYLIANGGYLSDEYELLPYDIAAEETKLFADELQAEELLEANPEGVVIAKCPDGDKILLCSDGKVVRFSHEEPAVTEEWGSLSQFVADSVNE